MKKIIFTIVVFFVSQVYSLSHNIIAFKFDEKELSSLDKRKPFGVKVETIYTVEKNENGNYLKAIADKGASGIGKKIIINLNKTPFINITWKIEKDIKDREENTKNGHDFAARVFVIKKTGATALSNRAMSYVYSTNMNVGDNWKSPFTKKSTDLVLSTTKENFNEWISVKSNVKEDFKKFHNLELDEIDGIAIMTDADNSNSKAISYYQNIYFSAD